MRISFSRRPSPHSGPARSPVPPDRDSPLLTHRILLECLRDARTAWRWTDLPGGSHCWTRPAKPRKSLPGLTRKAGKGVETGRENQLRVIASVSMKRLIVAAGVGLLPGGVFSAAAQERTPTRPFTWSNPLPFQDTEGRTAPRREVRDPCILREDDTYWWNMPASPGTEARARKRSSRRRWPASRNRRAT